VTNPGVVFAKGNEVSVGVQDMMAAIRNAVLIVVEPVHEGLDDFDSLMQVER
jgi:hypothetical protein